MEILVTIIFLFAFLIAGILAARFEPVRRSKVLELLSRIILPVLLLVMGYRIGISTDSATTLARSGTIALVFALSTALGTFIAVSVLCLTDRRKPRQPAGSTGRTSSRGSGSFLLLAMVVLGFFIGFFLPIEGFYASSATDWLLRFLLFSIGIDLTRSGISFFGALKDRSTVLLPLLTLAGSLAGGLAAAMILGMNIWKGLSVASGFGWYTLSGVLITDLGDPMLGSVAFLTNMLREAIAIMLIPFLGPTLFSRTAVGIAGATSMDVTLPLIERAAGTDIVPLSISHGVFASLMVPFLVPLFYGAG